MMAMIRSKQQHEVCTLRMRGTVRGLCLDVVVYSMSLCKPLANYVFWKILIRFSNKLNKKLNILFPKLQY